MWKLRGPPWGVGKVSELYSLNNEVFDWWSNLTSTVLDRLFWSPCYTYELWAKNQPRNLTARPWKNDGWKMSFLLGLPMLNFRGVYINISPLNIQWLEHDSFPFCLKRLLHPDTANTPLQSRRTTGGCWKCPETSAYRAAIEVSDKWKGVEKWWFVWRM